MNPSDHYHAQPWPHYLFTKDEWTALREQYGTADKLARYVTGVPTPFSGTPVYVDECPCDCTQGRVS